MSIEKRNRTLVELAGLLGVDQARLSFQHAANSVDRRAEQSTSRSLLFLDNSAKFNVKWYSKSIAEKVHHIVEISREIGAIPGLRVPTIYGLVESTDEVGVVEELISDASTMESLLASNKLSREDAAGIIRTILTRLLSKKVPAGKTKKRDQDRCLSAIRWMGINTTEYFRMNHLIRETDVFFMPQAVLMHEDLTPPNILLTPSLEPVLIDFELADYTTIPWFGVWRIGHVGGFAQVLWLDEWNLAGASKVLDLCAAMETDLQFKTLDPARFSLDRDRHWTSTVQDLTRKLEEASAVIKRQEEAIRSQTSDTINQLSKAAAEGISALSAETFDLKTRIAKLLESVRLLEEGFSTEVGSIKEKLVERPSISDVRALLDDSGSAVTKGVGEKLQTLTVEIGEGFEAGILRIKAQVDELALVKRSVQKLEEEFAVISKEVGEGFEAGIFHNKAQIDELAAVKGWVQKLEEKFAVISKEVGEGFEAGIFHDKAQIEELAAVKGWIQKLEERFAVISKEVGEGGENGRQIAKLFAQLLGFQEQAQLGLSVVREELEKGVSGIVSDQKSFSQALSILNQEQLAVGQELTRVSAGVSTARGEVKDLSAQVENVLSSQQAFEVRLDRTSDNLQLQIQDACKQTAALESTMLKQGELAESKHQIALENIRQIERVSGGLARDTREIQLIVSHLAKAAAPLVSVIVVNYNGKRFIDSLMGALGNQLYPNIEIVFVDNASSDNSVAYVREKFPHVRIVESKLNLGFSGGNNLGARNASGDYIVFLNNDTKPEREWLSYLVSRFTTLPNMGAVGSKITFYTRFLRLELSTTGFVPAQHGNSTDTRELGIAFDCSSGFVNSDYDKPLYVSGFYGAEDWGGRNVRWTNAQAVVFLPVPEDGDGTLRLILKNSGCIENQSVSLKINGKYSRDLVLAGEFSVYELSLDTEVKNDAGYIINNAGSFITEKGEAGDIGIAKPDDGTFDFAAPVTGLCGCSMMLSRNVFLDLGGFDEDFFMYYEDSDLCWRLRKKGLVLFYEPKSVVRHMHAASSTEWSPFFKYHVFRNSRLMKIKNLKMTDSIKELYSTWKSRAGVKNFGNAKKWKFARAKLNSLAPEEIEFLAYHHAIAIGFKILIRRLFRLEF